MFDKIRKIKDFNKGIYRDILYKKSFDTKNEKTKLAE